MPSLGSDHLKSFSEALHRLYAPVNPEDFAWRVLQVMDGLLPNSVLTYDEINQATGELTSRMMHREVDQAWLQRLRETIHQNPIVDYCAKGGPELVVKISDLVSQRQLQRTEFYQEVFHPMGVDYQTGVLIPVPGFVVGIAISRDKDFTEEDRTLCKLLSPHIVQAHTRAQEMRILQELRKNPAPSPERLRKLGMSNRESEVLHWLAQGKTDEEIGTILEASPRTVQKHVQRILAKLNVENRTAAALAAVEGVLKST